MSSRSNWLATGSLVVLALGARSVAGQEQQTAQPLAPAEAARTMVVPEGFRVTLFAGEPDVVQPVGFCIDDRGRLWVAEAHNYPLRGPARDRILIFADDDGDGRFDRRTVFCEGLEYVTGIEVGFGGAWVMSPPNLLFIPDRNADDKPDGAPVVLLDGFGTHANAHNLANGFAWGPDGWLYGTHGRTNWSLLGKPGTPESQRVRFDGGVYRYHPVRHEWEPFADGTTNPWGIDWDDYGQGFVCNCVDPHLFHVIQGAHYEPWRNRDSSRYAYERIPTIADHRHFIGRNGVREGLGTSGEDAAGGGHAHCGTLVYLGDNWPERYRNTVFMHNIHGRRINNDLLRRAGSGYIASHGPDLMRALDSWYMGVGLQTGPDGAVFASDWSDTGECHSMVNTQRGTGRIFKISFGTPAATNVDLAQLSDLELVALQLHRNDWHVRHARRLLQERAAAGADLIEVKNALLEMLEGNPAVDRKLRALWALHAIGAADDSLLTRLLDNHSEYVRAWAVRLVTEDRDPPAPVLGRLTEMAKSDSSAFVVLHCASALQQLIPEQRWDLAAALAGRSDLSSDANVPLLTWYGLEPLVEHDLPRFAALAGAARIPLLRRHIARRAASLPAERGALESIAKLLANTAAGDVQHDVLDGALLGLAGVRSAAMPSVWPAAYEKLQASNDAAVRSLAQRLALVFDDPVALESLRRLAKDPRADAAERNRVIEALVAKRTADLPPLLLDLLNTPAVRRSALRGLAAYDHPGTAQAILASFSSFDADARQDALQTLAARPTWALESLSAIEAGRIPRSEVTAYTARQLRSLGSSTVRARVDELWGPVRETSAEKAKVIGQTKRLLSPTALRSADASAGRKVFVQACANCHRLFDAGGAIGPDITGAQRTSVDYLLENLIDPSAAISRDYQLQVIATTDGRVVTGLPSAEGERALAVQTATVRIVIPLDEIESRRNSDASLMPDGLLQNLSEKEVQDLFAYLMGPEQVPLPE
ncbi:MAG: PVC-type heme-binding CxxCH protein [Pirellulales bacterium]